MASRYDVVVCGGGTAGCILAARLSEQPDRSVCLVEAGPDYGPYQQRAWPADLLDGRQLAFSHSWETEREDRSQLRARVIGGCSAHNACVVIEAPPEDYDTWGPGWTHADLRPYLDRAREQLRTRRFRDEELSPWHRAFADEGDNAAVVHDVNAVADVRWNTAFAYLDEARARPNLTILPEALVDRLDGNRLLTGRGELEAETIVIAAGAYGSPGILLRSGLGEELPVGDELADHVGVGFAFQGTERLQEEMRRFAVVHSVFMAQVTVRADGGDLFLFPALEPGEGGWEASGAVFLMAPASRGHVSLTSRDARAPLRIEHGFLSAASDLASLARGVDVFRALASTGAIRRLAGSELRPGVDVEAEAHVREAARGFFHPTGTCGIGRVVGANGRVFGHEHVVVADASIMPTPPRANTNLTTVAIAERIAGLLGS